MRELWVSGFDCLDITIVPAEYLTMERGNMHNYSELFMDCIAIVALLYASFLFGRIIKSNRPLFARNNAFIKVALCLFILDIITRIVFCLFAYDSVNLSLRLIVHGSFVALYVLLFVSVFRKQRNTGN